MPPTSLWYLDLYQVLLYEFKVEGFSHMLGKKYESLWIQTTRHMVFTFFFLV